MLTALAMAQLAQTFTLEKARAMSSEQLAKALLGPDAASIERVVVHPVGMEVPARSLHKVTMIGVPGPAAGGPGWCRRIDKIAHLTPVVPGGNSYVNAMPTQVEKIEERESVRLADGDCSKSDAAFFSVNPKKRASQFALIQRLLVAREQAKSGRPLPFELQCVDEDGARAPAFGGNRCLPGNGRALLASLPLERAFNVSAGGQGVRYSLNRVDGTRTRQPVHFDAQVGMNDGKLAVDVTVGESEGRITRMTIKRHIPYPF